MLEDYLIRIRKAKTKADLLDSYISLLDLYHRSLAGHSNHSTEDVVPLVKEAREILLRRIDLKASTYDL